MLELLNEGHQRSRLMGHHGEIRGQVQQADNTALCMYVYVTERERENMSFCVSVIPLMCSFCN